MNDDDFEPAVPQVPQVPQVTQPEFMARGLLLANLNLIEDAYAQADNADAVFAIMQAKSDLGLPINREGWPQ